MTHVVYEFAGFQLDARARRLLDGGRQQIVLPPRAFDLLLLLVEKHGDLLDKPTLIRTVWRNVVVADNNLDQNISILRRALRGSAGSRPLISTERGRGYRFVATVHERRAGGPSPTRHDDALQPYLQASSLLVRPSPDNLRGAAALLDTAIARDPGFLVALAERALLRVVCYSFDIDVEGAIAAAVNEARKVLAIDPDCARAHQALACALNTQGDWGEALPHHEAASRLEQQPDAALTRIWQLSQSVGHLRKALDQARQIEGGIPLQPLGAIALMITHSYLAMDSTAMRHAERAAQLGWPRTHASLVDFHFHTAVRQRRFDDAATGMRDGFSPAMHAAGAVEMIELVCGGLQNPAMRHKAVERLQRFLLELPASELGMVNRKRALLWLTLLGAVDHAFAFMHQTLDCFALTGTIGNAWGLLWTPEMKPLRRDPRFQGLVARLRLVEFWQAHGPPDGYELRDGNLVELPDTFGAEAMA